MSRFAQDSRLSRNLGNLRNLELIRARLSLCAQHSVLHAYKVAVEARASEFARRSSEAAMAEDRHRLQMEVERLRAKGGGPPGEAGAQAPVS
jgi:predicted deacetylase